VAVSCGMILQNIGIAAAQHSSRVDTGVLLRVAGAEFRHAFDIPMVRLRCRNRPVHAVTDKQTGAWLV
jgi:hypothetical protein